MKHRIYILLMSLCFTVVACSEHKLIPDETLQAIITESLISEAIVTNASMGLSGAKRSEIDSLDVYKPILSRNGYTIQDFDYTIRTLAMRKSKPLDNIFENVLKDIELRDAKASALYERLLDYDSLCITYYSDTLYIKDTMIRGALSRFKLPETRDVRSGKYILTFKYRTVDDYRAGTKSLNYEVKGRSMPKKSATLWLNRSQKEADFRGEISVDRQYDTITFKFVDPVIDKSNQVQDTSYIRDIRLVYHPELSKMRLDYMYEQSGLIPSITEYYEKRFPYLSDSVTIPFVKPIKTEPKRSN